MGQTPTRKLPYPELTDSPDVPRDIKALAMALETNTAIGGFQSDVQYNGVPPLTTFVNMAWTNSPRRWGSPAGSSSNGRGVGQPGIYLFSAHISIAFNPADALELSATAILPMTQADDLLGLQMWFAGSSGGNWRAIFRLMRDVAVTPQPVTTLVDVLVPSYLAGTVIGTDALLTGVRLGPATTY
jgi:hypothetical protein